MLNPWPTDERISPVGGDSVADDGRDIFPIHNGVASHSSTIDKAPSARPQFSLALLFELKALLGILLAVPLIGRALFTAAAIMAVFILVQLPLFWLFGAFRMTADEQAS